MNESMRRGSHTCLNPDLNPDQNEFSNKCIAMSLVSKQFARFASAVDDGKLGHGHVSCEYSAMICTKLQMRGRTPATNDGKDPPWVAQTA
jgi:hypothetical protein